MLNTKLTSVILPVFNEENSITPCLKSLLVQTHIHLEIIVVDDGSSDNTLNLVKKFDVKTFKQMHKGPGSARNLGAKNAIGNILVFIDADMTFDKNFIKDLISPILDGKTIGTFSKNEFVANKNNIWSNCWNINRNVPIDKMLPNNFPNQSPVYRAILKKEFDKVGGFDITGEYTDDWSIYKKTKQKSSAVQGAIYYHSNPSNLSEIYKQARWIGKSEFISGDFIRKIRSIIFYSLPISLTIGTIKSIIHLKYQFIIFKVAYDFGIWLSVLKSFTNEPKFK